MLTDFSGLYYFSDMLVVASALLLFSEDYLLTNSLSKKTERSMVLLLCKNPPSPLGDSSPKEWTLLDCNSKGIAWGITTSPLLSKKSRALATGQAGRVFVGGSFSNQFRRSLETRLFYGPTEQCWLIPESLIRWEGWHWGVMWGTPIFPWMIGEMIHWSIGMVQLSHLPFLGSYHELEGEWLVTWWRFLEWFYPQWYPIRKIIYTIGYLSDIQWNPVIFDPKNDDHDTPWKINGWFTYKSPIFSKENDLNQTSKEDVPAVSLQGCTSEEELTLPETNIAPENWWLEYYFPIGEAYFQGLR